MPGNQSLLHAVNILLTHIQSHIDLSSRIIKKKCVVVYSVGSECVVPIVCVRTRNRTKSGASYFCLGMNINNLEILSCNTIEISGFYLNLLAINILY